MEVSLQFSDEHLIDLHLDFIYHLGLDIDTNLYINFYLDLDSDLGFTLCSSFLLDT